MDSVIEIEITCASCQTRDKVKTVLGEYQASTQVEWTCPVCGAKRTTIIRKKEVEKETEENIQPIKKFVFKEGKRIEIGEDGEPLKKESSFKVAASKKKKKRDISFSAKVKRLE